MDNSKNILITGAAGFIGRQLTDKLIELEYNVIQIDDLSVMPIIKPHSNLLNQTVQNISNKFLNANNIHTVIHLAAKKNVKDSFYNLDNSIENYEMTLKLFSACVDSKVKKIMLASTCEIFGFQSNTLNENSVFKPHSPYAVSKVANEYLSDMYMMLDKSLLITSLNFFNTYGPSEGIDAVIPNFISKAINSEKILIEGDGKQSRDFTFIDDTINTLIEIINSEKYFRSINIGSGVNISINELISILKKYFLDINYDFVDKRPNEINSFIANNRLIKSEFNFKSTILIEEGIKKVIEFYKLN